MVTIRTFILWGGQRFLVSWASSSNSPMCSVQASVLSPGCLCSLQMLWQGQVLIPKVITKTVLLRLFVFFIFLFLVLIGRLWHHMKQTTFCFCFRACWYSLAACFGYLLGFWGWLLSPTSRSSCSFLCCWNSDKSNLEFCPSGEYLRK